MVKQTYNLLIIGYYYRDNYGDDLLQIVAKRLLAPKYQSHGYSLNLKFLSSEQINPIPEDIDKITKWSDKIVLFGGEVLNSYFLDKLIFIKNYSIYNLKKNIPNKVKFSHIIIINNNNIHLDGRLFPKLANHYNFWLL